MLMELSATFSALVLLPAFRLTQKFHYPNTTMLTQQEKFAAINAAYPKIPSKVRAQVANKLVTLDNVKAFVLAHVRHNMTSYELRVTGSHRNCTYAGIRADAMVRVYQIVSDWK